MANDSFRAVVAKAGINPFVDVPARVTRAFAPFGERGYVRVAGAINSVAQLPQRNRIPA